LRKSWYLNLFDSIGTTTTYWKEELLQKNLDALKTFTVAEKFAGCTPEDLACTSFTIEFKINPG
jgi:hypothetical protein